MNKMITKLEESAKSDPSTTRNILLSLGQMGTQEVLEALLVMKSRLPKSQLASWREAVDDCLERCLATLPQKPTGPEFSGKTKNH